MNNSLNARYAVTDIRDVQIAWFVWLSDARNFKDNQDTPKAYKVIKL